MSERWRDTYDQWKTTPPDGEDDDYPLVACPGCGDVQKDMDGFGFLSCKQCGHCTHPSSELISEKWICGLCGAEAL